MRCLRSRSLYRMKKRAVPHEKKAQTVRRHALRAPVVLVLRYIFGTHVRGTCHAIHFWHTRPVILVLLSHHAAFFDCVCLYYQRQCAHSLSAPDKSAFPSSLQETFSVTSGSFAFSVLSCFSCFSCAFASFSGFFFILALF